jgi:oxygen-dependent protoporphyrinogen oxidase
MVKFLIKSPSSKIAVLGAGITGLTAAWELKKNLQDVTVFEKESRGGGWINTAFHEGSLFEWGPRSIRLQDAHATLQLIGEMGLTNEIITASPKANTRYILRQGKLQPVRVFPLVFQLIRDLFVSKCPDEDESIYDFFSRRFSKTVADRFVDPLVKGIYAGDPKLLSIRSCFPQMWNMEQQSGSLLLGMFRKKKERSGIITLKRGLGSLVKALTDKLPIAYNSPVKQITFEEGKVLLHLENETKMFDQVISTLPAHALAVLLPDSKLSSLLKEIPFASVGVVHLGYFRDVNPYPGFGYLVPTLENEDILGIVFDSSIFPEQSTHPNQTRLTVMIRGDAVDLPGIAKKAVRNHLGIQEEPDIIESRYAKNAIPQYPVGFHKLLEEITEASTEFPNLTLLGTSFHGVSVNQAIAQASNPFAFQKCEEPSI